jgi:serine/threonine-protein kinase
MLRGEPTVAVRSFAYRGPDDTSYLGDGITEELIDSLSRTRGLRVVVATNGEPLSDPDEIGAFVDGTVQRQGNRFRIIARLTSAQSKTQLWSEVFQGEFEDLFEAQELIARKVAEALRIEVQASARPGDLPAKAAQLYLKARQQVRRRVVLGEGGAIELLERCLELAPSFAPAIAWHSLASARSFWDERSGTDKSVEDLRSLVDEALERAPAQAESHLAAAVLCNQSGEYARCARHLAECLEVAPTCAEAHAYLGELQCSTGRVAEGFERLRLARHLDPLRSVFSSFAFVRNIALAGDWEAVEGEIEQVHQGVREINAATLALFYRFGLWARREDWLEQVLKWSQAGGGYATRLFREGSGYVLGRQSAESFDAGLRSAAESMHSLRFRTLLYQILTDSHAYVGESELALAALESAAGCILNDIDWMQRCPVLEPLRSDARFQRLHDIVQRRAESVWLGEPGD